MGMNKTEKNPKDWSFFHKTEFFLSYNLGQDPQNPHPSHWYHNDPPPTLISQGQKWSSETSIFVFLGEEEEF